jgi:hypothetical protein
MTYPPGAEMCQGYFAATVKEILPMYQSGAPAMPNYVEQLPHKLPRICGNSPLTNRLVWRN